MNKIPPRIVLIASFVGFTVLIVLGLIFLPGKFKYARHAKVTLPDGFIVSADVADTAILRTQGLSGRWWLGADEGMLFLFDTHNIPSFWMPNMKFPIDIIWLDENRVVSVSADAQPEEGVPVLRYSPEAPVNKVLEVPAGTAKAHGIKPGDTLDIQMEYP